MHGGYEWDGCLPIGWESVAVVAGRSVDFGLVGDESENLEFSGEGFGGGLFIRRYFSKDFVP